MCGVPSVHPSVRGRSVDEEGALAVRRRTWLNLELLSCGLTSAISGITIQVRFHMHHVVEAGVEASSHALWLLVHKGSSALLVVLVAWHLSGDWKWPRALWTARRSARHKQLVSLSVLFGIATLTGLVDWAFGGLGVGRGAEKGTIEIHDKVTILLTVLFALQIWARRGRLVT